MFMDHGTHTIVRNRLLGFTLIEVLITVALAAFLMAAMAQLYVMYGQMVLSQRAAIEVVLGDGSLVDTVRAAGMQASQVVAAHTFSGVDLASGTTTALFELPAIDASGAIIVNAYDYIGIYASDHDAYHVIDAAPGSVRVSGQKRLTDVLDELRFTYDNASFPLVTSVIVDATTTATVKGQTSKLHLREHIYLRNI